MSLPLLIHLQKLTIPMISSLMTGTKGKKFLIQRLANLKIGMKMRQLKFLTKLLANLTGGLTMNQITCRILMLKNQKIGNYYM